MKTGMMRVVKEMIIEDSMRRELAKHRRTINQNNIMFLRYDAIRLLERRSTAHRQTVVIASGDIMLSSLVETSRGFKQASESEVRFRDDRLVGQDRFVAVDRFFGIGRFKRQDFVESFGERRASSLVDFAKAIDRSGSYRPSFPGGMTSTGKQPTRSQYDTIISSRLRKSTAS